MKHSLTRTKARTHSNRKFNATLAYLKPGELAELEEELDEEHEEESDTAEHDQLELAGEAPDEVWQDDEDISPDFRDFTVLSGLHEDPMDVVDASTQAACWNPESSWVLGIYEESGSWYCEPIIEEFVFRMQAEAAWVQALRDVSAWLETYAQPFLKSGDLFDLYRHAPKGDSKRLCIARQKDFCAIVAIKEASALSRIKSDVVLLWADQMIPLAALFTQSSRDQWVMAQLLSPSIWSDAASLTSFIEAAQPLIRDEEPIDTVSKVGGACAAADVPDEAFYNRVAPKLLTLLCPTGVSNSENAHADGLG